MSVQELPTALAWLVLKRLDDIEMFIRLEDARNLLLFHSSVRTGRGRRFREVSLNRAAVVLAIAAWQSFVESSVLHRLEALEPLADWYEAGGEDPRFKAAQADYARIRARVVSAVDRFSTPNAENVRSLFLTVGFDPYPHWDWSQSKLHITPESAVKRLNEWVKVRHAIAHGDPALPEVTVISRTSRGVPTLHKKDAQKCITLVNNLAAHTGW